MKRYTNYSGKEIPFQQVTSLNSYKIEVYNNVTGGVKEKQSIRKSRDNEITIMYDYYLEDGENQDLIVQEYLNKENALYLSVYKNKQIINGFIVWDVVGYHISGAPASPSKKVYDNLGRLIMSCSIDPQSEAPVIGSVTKYYYMEDFVNLWGLDNMGIVELKFAYRNSVAGYIDITLRLTVDDELTQMHVFDYIDLDDFLSESLYPNFLTEHPYYQSSLPIIPESEEL